MARSVRASRAQRSLYEDGSDSDDGNAGGDNSDYDATPKPKKPSGNAKGKKRVSDVHHNSHSHSNGIVTLGSSPSRVPLKAVNINDDEAEKRKRRKSAKLAQPMLSFEDESQGDHSGAGAGPSSSQDGAGRSGDTPRARQLKQKQQLMSVAEAPVVNVPLDVMSSNFEEWMKMATDNKINATNSWNFALIDYFHDMSLLRNNQDNSINFQKASCTLDGCVKIWTSRVDSVGTETGRLLSNLANEGKGDDEDGDLSDNPDSNDPSQRNKRPAKTQRQEATLAKNVAQLKSKKLDLEFSVDPLFKKTCADFDEGGAQGLLMNHLSLGVGSEGSMRVIFDASDSMGKGKDDEDDEDLVEPVDEIDLSYLRSEFIPDVSSLDDKAISHSLEGFSFSKDSLGLDSSTFFNAPYVDDTQDDDDDLGDFGATGGGGDFMDVDGGAPGGGAEDFFVGDQAVDDDYGGMGDDQPGMDGDGAGAGGMDDGGATAAQQGPRIGGFEPFDPRRAPNERDLILAMTEPGAEGSSLDYFDQTFVKNWAGPEHWKLRKVIRKPDVTADTTANKTRREKKEPFKIDFLTPATKPQKEIMKEIFAPVTRGGSITLPYFSKSGKKGGRGKGKDKREKRIEQTLPDDMHFSSRQLVTLFLKPKFALKMRGQRARLNDRDGEVDENFWAQAADQAAGRRAEDDDEANPAAIPFNTQFFHDDDDFDGPGFDDGYDGDGPISGNASGAAGVSGENDSGDRDLLSETQGLGRRVRPETVNYAKRAKRVDVRKLKENIWKGLDIIVPEGQGEEANGEQMATDETRPPTDPTEARTFTSVVSDLERSYPKDKLEEISTSFCFICLLHLANEQGLKLEVDKEDETEDMNEEVKVGNIFGLKVYRDPTAIPSA